MKLKNLSCLIIGLLIGCLFPLQSLFAQQPIKLIINGKQIQCDVPPQNISGRVLVPARYVAENLNASVDWDGVNNAVVITSNQQGNVVTPPVNTPITVPTPQPISPSVQIPSENKTNEQYQSFQSLFAIGEKIFHSNGGDLTSKATYNGSLNEDDFFKYWNALDKLTKEEFVKRLGAEVQSINPTIDIAIDFWYKDVKLGYVIAYSSKYQICSFSDNPQLKQNDIKQ